MQAMSLSPAKRRFYAMLPWLICGVGALFYCYEYFLRVTPSVMKPQLMSTFGIDNAAFGLLAAFYYYAYTPLQLPVGILMDRFGPRRLLTVACIICAIGTYLFSISSFGIAGAGRFMVGVGSAFGFVGVLKLATIWLPPQRFAMVAGMVTALGMLGPVLGDLFLTPMVAHIGWHQTVIITSVLGLLLAAFIWSTVRDRARTETHPEQRIVTRATPTTFIELFKGLGEMMKFRQVWLAGLIGCCTYLPITLFAELWGIPYLEQAQDFPAAHAAMINTLLFIGFAIGGILIGFISDKIKRRRSPLMIGGFVAFLISCVLLYTAHLPLVIVCLLLFGLGFFSGAENIVFAISRESVPNRFAGTSLAMTNFLTMVGGMIFQPVIGWLLDEHSAAAGRSALNLANSDYRYALTILPLCLLLSVILTYFVRETGARVQEKI